MVLLFLSASGTWSSAFVMFILTPKSSLTFSIIARNSPSQWMVLMWNPALLFTRSTISITRQYSLCVRLSIGIALLNLIVQSIVVINPHSLTYIMSMQSSISRLCATSSSGILTVSSLTGVDFQRVDFQRVDFPFRLVMSAPKIFLAMFTSSVVTGQFLIAFILTNNLNVSIVGVPTI
jgi:hypothetical protein